MYKTLRQECPMLVSFDPRMRQKDSNEGLSWHTFLTVKAQLSSHEPSQILDPSISSECERASAFSPPLLFRT